MTSMSRRRGALREIWSGIAAVSVKELRGRMRGRRAFVMLTIHLLIVAGFAFMIEEVAVRTVSNSFGGGVATSDIGRALFTALLMLLTLVVLILGPASTSGAISLEREKQTLDMLSTTPISSLAIVVGKLVSALGWMFMLLLASIPVMALVFMFGGVGPEDLVRGYVVLFASAILYGSLGLFFSALLKRTQAATVINLVLAIGLTAGTAGVYGVAASIAMSDAQQKANEANQQVDYSKVMLPPTAMLWMNPFVTQMDVLCHSDTSFGLSCGVILVITGRMDIAAGQNTGIGGVQGFGMPSDSYWPGSVAMMLLISALLILASTQLISPTRRWHRPHRVPRAVAVAAAPTIASPAEVPADVAAPIAPVAVPGDPVADASSPGAPASDAPSSEAAPQDEPAAGPP
jgi:ABC-type transport system involved in multi-copper enzyme maturation permease subunit